MPALQQSAAFSRERGQGGGNADVVYFVGWVELLMIILVFVSSSAPPSSPIPFTC